jgi:hypothetical protein
LERVEDRRRQQGEAVKAMACNVARQYAYVRLMDSFNHTLMKRCLGISLIVLLLSGCERKNRVRQYNKVWGWPPDYNAVVFYGFTDSRVHFAVFESKEGSIEPRAKVTMIGDFCEGYLELPDGTKVDLPTSNHIYEFTSGRFTSAPIDFTRAQLNAYLDSHPKPPTIEGLKLFSSKAP